MPSSPAWTWRHAIQESDLEPTTRFVLLNLSISMNEKGEGCWPSIDTQAKETGLSRKTVIVHLKKAEAAGWLRVEQIRFRGQNWRHNQYFAVWPDRTESAAMVDPVPLKGDVAATPSLEEGGEPEGRRGVTDGKKVVYELHPTSPSDLSKDSSIGESTPGETESCNYDSSSCDDVGPSVDLFGGQSESFVPPRLTGEEVDSFFDQVFWPEYPRKCSKKEARRAIHRILRKPTRLQANTLEAEIMEGLRRYKQTKPEQQAWLHPSTFLNKERWTDEENADSDPDAVDGMSPAEIMAHTFDTCHLLTNDQLRYFKLQLEKQEQEREQEAIRRLGRAAAHG